MSLVKQHRNLKVIIANTDRQKQLACRIRYISYRQAGLIKTSSCHLKDKCECDPFDEYSTIFLLYLDGKPIGTMRVILARMGPLEVESAIPTYNFRKNQDYLHSCEFGRLAVFKKYKQHFYSLLLIGAAINFAQEHNCYHVFLETRKKSLHSFFRQLGTIPVLYHQKHPWLKLKGLVLMKMDLGSPNSLRRKMYNFFTSTWDWSVRYFNPCVKAVLLITSLFLYSR